MSPLPDNMCCKLEVMPLHQGAVGQGCNMSLNSAILLANSYLRYTVKPLQVVVAILPHLKARAPWSINMYAKLMGDVFF